MKESRSTIDAFIQGECFYVGKKTEYAYPAFLNGVKENFYAIFLCQEGSCSVLIEDSRYDIHAGDLFIYLPNQFLKIVEKSEELRGIIYCTQREDIKNVTIEVKSFENLFSIRQQPCVTLHPRQFSFLEGFIGQIIDLDLSPINIDAQGKPSRFHEKTLQSLKQTVGFFILDIINYSTPIVPQRQDRKDVVFQKFILSLFNNYNTEREVSYYAAEQCLTPRYFSSVVKAVSGKSAQQWIVEIVVDNMKKALTSSELTIKEIAFRFNFPSQSFFGKYFKQYTGMSPKDFRSTQSIDSE